MRHRVKKIKLSRSKGAKKALVRNLATSLILEGKIKTTLAKAKVAKSFVEKLINISKKGDLAAKRRIIALLPNKKAAEKLFSDFAPRFTNRDSGFLRIRNLVPRRGDSAKMALLEFLPLKKEKEEEKKSKEISTVKANTQNEEKPKKTVSKKVEAGNRKNEEGKKSKKQ